MHGDGGRSRNEIKQNKQKEVFHSNCYLFVYGVCCFFIAVQGKVLILNVKSHDAWSFYDSQLFSLPSPIDLHYIYSVNYEDKHFNQGVQ